MATIRFGPLQIAGNLQAQNIIRHPDADTFQFVQQRPSTLVSIDPGLLAKMDPCHSVDDGLGRTAPAIRNYRSTRCLSFGRTSSGALKTFEAVLRENPDHPGANHFYIHAIEASNQAYKAVPCAQRLAGLMPARYAKSERSEDVVTSFY